MDNLELLNYCIKNPEHFFDSNYMFTDKDQKLTLYINNTKKIKNLLIAIKELLKRNENKTADKLFLDLQKSVKNNKYSEYICFVNACDINLEHIIKDIGLLKKVTTLYLENRDLNEVVPSEWVQALIDSGASRRKGQAGENKLIELLENCNFKKVAAYSDFTKENKCVAKFKKTGDFSLLNIQKNLGITFGGNNQNKQLDLIIKNKDDTYFLEAKHMHISGGAQNKQILELIELIREQILNPKYHIISFLDGTYFNIIFNTKNIDKEIKNKIINQQEDIIEALTKNKNNYFINTAGFKKLFSN